MAGSPQSETATPDFDGDGIHLPATIARNEKTVRGGFWRKLARSMSRIPFAIDAIAAYYCAFDPATPLRVRAILLAALAYFVMPFDVIPDVLLGVGFADDLTVLATALGLVKTHINQTHYVKAQKTIDDLDKG